jgi:nitroimidazol reductase NimA-like FMN-containing flavoprotein (pyridoxamine 5'-phosphate oxidase superfamily)
VTDPKKRDFLAQVRDLLRSQRVGVLATHYKNAPHQSLVAYVASDDLRDIFFVTPAYTRKVAAMEEDPHVALLVDNRENMARDFDACIAATAKGTAEQLSAREARRFVPRYLERHPYLEEFVTSPSCRRYRIRVQTYTLVSRFQTVEELSLP